VTLRNYAAGRIGKNFAYCFNGAVSQPRAAGEESQNLDQHLFRCIYIAICKKRVKSNDFPGVLVRRICQRNPVEGIGKNCVHSALLGTPYM
jgi:hypothetical protein